MTVLGTRYARREDAPILTGEARYIDDLQVPGALHIEIGHGLAYFHQKISP